MWHLLLLLLHVQMTNCHTHHRPSSPILHKLPRELIQELPQQQQQQIPHRHSTNSNSQAQGGEDELDDANHGFVRVATRSQCGEVQSSRTCMDQPPLLLEEEVIPVSIRMVHRDAVHGGGDPKLMLVWYGSFLL